MIRADLASARPMTNTRSIHRRTVTIRSTSSDEYFSSREDLSRNNTPGTSSVVRRSPAPEPIDPGTSAWHIQSAQATDPWGEATNASTSNDPNYPVGSWNPGDRERALAQIKWDLPVPVLENDNLSIKQIDALPPYFAREALAIPRAQFGYHSPAYDTRAPDPFATLRRNTIPFPTTRRNQIPPVPFGQWPDKSDTSDSSSESDQGRQQQRGADATDARLEESIPHLDLAHRQTPSMRRGPDYEWNTLVQIDRDILGPE